MSKEYYIICVEEKSRESTLLFWKPNAKGYTSAMEDAGLYTEEEAYVINKKGRDIALTKEELASIAKIYTVADCSMFDLLKKKDEMKK